MIMGTSRTAPVVRRLAVTQGIPEAGIRAFTRADIPDVVALRAVAFLKSAQQSPDALAAYFDRLFFPMAASAESPSLVHTNERGEIDGFIGVVELPMRLDGRPISARIATQLMVAPTSRGLVGPRLVRAFLGGPQDLSISDAANDQARRMWEAMGGRAIPAHSVRWTAPVRPARATLARCAHSAPARALAYAARPAAQLLDAVLWRRLPIFDGRVQGDRADLVPIGLAVPELLALFSRWRLHPHYDVETAALRVQRLAEMPALGPVRSLLVRSGAGVTLGWVLYCANRGGTAEVVQLATKPGACARVLARLWDDAHAQGVVALSGRVDGESWIDIGEATGARFSRSGSCTVAHARDPQLLSVVQGEDAFFSRLDGEWALAF
jgi:hypothetical protein